MNTNICKECKKSFDSERALHCHIKVHSMTLAEYYVKFFQRKNKLTGDLLPFKNKQDYFTKDFSNRTQLIKWCGESGVEVKDYILKMLSDRITSKSLVRGPGHVELKFQSMPDLDSYMKYFDSYTEACRLCGVTPLFGKRIPPEFFEEIDMQDMKIFIDTREQQPLTFGNSEKMKLDFGDYTSAGEYYDYTYVDRKSANDLIGTLSLGNLDRFKREISRARDLGSYLFIVIDSDMPHLEAYMRAAKSNKFGPHRTNLKFIYHNMREIMHEFADSCQFVFSGSRENSERIIEKILFFGRKLWNVDVQYYIEKHGLGTR
tara:strand:+ start:4469 stop:5419 length:951 start_codon:yes stop_codon:yes gene_type:complete